MVTWWDAQMVVSSHHKGLAMETRYDTYLHVIGQARNVACVWQSCGRYHASHQQRSQRTVWVISSRADHPFSRSFPETEV